MEALTIIILICVLIGLYCLVKIMKGMAKLKEQNDMIYEKKLEEDQLIEKCKKIAEEIDNDNFPYEHEVKFRDDIGTKFSSSDS